MNRVALQRVLLAPAIRQSILPGRLVGLGIGSSGRALSSVTEVSFWKSLVPKPLRSRLYDDKKMAQKPKPAKEWNPATFFIFIFLLIGSMSIQMISLRRDFTTFMRQADVRIGLLREVVEKLQRGEEVDVERVLGTGDPDKELDWEEVLKQIERAEPVKSQRKKQPETAPTPSPEADVPPAPEPAREKVQSTLATKGFY